MSRLFILWGTIFMALGIGAGAFGTHALADYFSRYPNVEGTFATAVRYHIYHALALFITAWIADKWPTNWATWSGYLFLLGILLFSGSLYLLVLTRVTWLGAITPLGGIAFLSGWLCLFITAWRN